MAVVAMGSVSATDVTVKNDTHSVDDIQGVISGSDAGDLLEGGTLTLEEGDYRFDKGLVIDKSINIVGNGNVRIIGNNIDLSTSLANSPGVDRFGIHITANNVNLTGITFIGFFYGISVNNAINTTINNCIAIDNRRGIELTNVDGVFIKNTKMNNNLREGINFGGTNIHITNSEMNNNLFEGVHGHASNSGIYNSNINGNGFGAAGTSTMPGIDLHGHGDDVANFTLEGNTVKYNAGAGLWINIHSAIVKNNTFSENEGNGISIKHGNYDANDNLIDGNTITKNKGNGIEINAGGARQNGEFSVSGNVISNNLIDDNDKNGIVVNKVAPSMSGTGSIVEKNLLILNTISNNGEVAIVNTGDHTIGLFNTMSGNVNGNGDNLNTDTVVYVDKPVERIVHVDRPVTNTVTNTVTKTVEKNVIIVPTVKASKSRVKRGRIVTVSVRLKNFGKDRSNSIKVYNRYTKRTLSTILNSGQSKTLKFRVKVNKKGINKIPILINGRLVATVRVRGL